MAHYGTLRDYRFADNETEDDIRGSNVYSAQNDDKLGDIDDVIFDHSTGEIRYVVIDTGGWLSSKKFIVPPDRLRPSNKHEDDFVVDASKQQIESFPPYQEKDVESEERWKDYEKRYKDAWHDGPVLHRHGSDRIITPTPDEMPAQGSGSSQSGQASSFSGTDRIIPAGADDVTIQNSAAGIGPRWDTFVSRLRQRRRDVVQSCTTCSVGPASDRGSESAADERKAV